MPTVGDDAVRRAREARTPEALKKEASSIVDEIKAMRNDKAERQLEMPLLPSIVMTVGSAALIWLVVCLFVPDLV